MKSRIGLQTGMVKTSNLEEIWLRQNTWDRIERLATCEWRWRACWQCACECDETSDRSTRSSTDRTMIDTHTHTHTHTHRAYEYDSNTLDKTIVKTVTAAEQWVSDIAWHDSRLDGRRVRKVNLTLDTMLPRCIHSCGQSSFRGIVVLLF